MARTWSSDAGFVQRTSMPEKGNKYYTQKSSGGYSNNILGNTAKLGPLAWAGCVLPNCTGYACGRYNEISGTTSGKSWGFTSNAVKFVEYARSNGFSTGQVPAIGAMIVWSNGGGAGHVAVVEEVISTTKIRISHSGWGFNTQRFQSTTLEKGSGNWTTGLSWLSSYSFRCFIYNTGFSPKILDADTIPQGSTINPTLTKALQSQQSSLSEALDAYNKKAFQSYQTVVVQNYSNNSKGRDLLTSNSLVESPFIIAKIGEYTFGSYTKEGSLEKANSSMRVTYPNYMQSITINKTNGVLNVYELKMVYQIVPGKDPNLLDRVFSSIADSREITLSYGDWCSPAFIYKEEQAIITKVTSHIDFASQRIDYTVACQSKALAASAQTHHFIGGKAQGSQVIRGLLNAKNYGLTSVFTAMADAQFVADNGLIPSDDKVVTLDAKDMTVVDYLNYVVGCMSAKTNSNSTIKDSTYHLIINDDIKGLYFKIVKIGTTTRTLTSSDVYEVDIGYPTSTLVTSFDINTDNSWSILYNYSDKINVNNYIYNVGDDGKVYSDYVDSNTAVSAYYNRATEIDKTWWTRMTQFPITATLTIKGLLRPAILMNYIRINTYFYGQKHISSGLYAITKQEDKIDASGYRTTLSLVRISGDEDVTYNYTQTTVTNGSNKNVESLKIDATQKGYGYDANSEKTKKYGSRGAR